MNLAAKPMLSTDIKVELSNSRTDREGNSARYQKDESGALVSAGKSNERLSAKR